MIKDFVYKKTTSVDEAVSELRESLCGKIIAGGTDIVGVINEKIKDSCPDKLVSLKGAVSDTITEEDGMVRIGAMTKLSDIENSEIIRDRFGVLRDAAHNIASPQIRHMATIGGNICQEPRCWYYRYQDDKFHCMRKGGELCNAMMGNNIYHSVFGGAKVCKSPCESQCPNGTAIPEYLDLLRRDDIDDAAALLWEMNPLAAVVGRVCPHTCQSKCNRNEYDEPVSIRNIERTVGDHMLKNADRLIKKPKDQTGKTVSIIGAGPAGLTAAYYSALAGHRAVIYDANDKAGGMLRYGIPAYRLPRDILDRIVDILEDLGVTFRQNCIVGKDIDMAEMKKESDAILIAVGAWKSAKIGCPGEDADGVIGGIEFLKQASEGGDTGVKGKVVAVVGGGNTAMDCCRTAKRLGAGKVYNFYRRTEAEMPAEREEISDAKDEGVEFRYLVSPSEIVAEGGSHIVKLQKMTLGEPDSSGRRRPVPVEGEIEEIKVDILLAAIGQKVDMSGIGIDFDAEENVFMAGDAALGPKTAIEAIADARKTAEKINLLLGGEPSEVKETTGKELYFDDSCIKQSEPIALKMLPVAERSYDREDTESASFEAVKAEANRCYNCGCVAVSPSDIAPALMVLDAQIVTSRRTMPVAELFTAGFDTSTVLDSDEIVEEIVISDKNSGSNQLYRKFRTRKTIDFPIVGMASNIDVKDGIISSAKLAFSGVAPVPYELSDVEGYITGRRPTAELAEEAGRLAVKDVRVLEENKFKVQVIRAYVKRAITDIAEKNQRL